jgi:SagB-type dehydrogenase family enzyme
MSEALAPTVNAADITIAYHNRTKHRPERYAPGPETLDWDAQPNPFREFAGSKRIPLPLSAHMLTGGFNALYAEGAIQAAPLSLTSISTLLELSLGLTAWKEYGPDRWALRSNPSSGNLHPTEAYILTQRIQGLDDGLYHYLSRDHVLEQRAISGTASSPAPRLWLGLSSIHWREAWKYGERAFRYCQLDIGHAIGAIRHAAAALGWKAHIIPSFGHTALASLLGLGRAEDFGRAEREDPDLLIAIDSPGQEKIPSWDAETQWSGQANLLDPHPMYRWSVIDEVATATRSSPHATDNHAAPGHLPLFIPESSESATRIILNRRSAQRFDSKHVMAADIFHRLLDSVLPRPSVPWDIWGHPPCLHPVLFVHRVAGIAPGLYILPRHAAAEPMLREALKPDFSWHRPKGTPAHLPLYQLLAADCCMAARILSCNQAIAGESCFSIGMIGEFEDNIRADPWYYRQLHWEAGLIGQVLYLQSEAEGLRGTGIGCYFDDSVHELLGLKSAKLQSLYHFTIGFPLTDTRITSLPAYPDREGS